MLTAKTIWIKIFETRSHKPQTITIPMQPTRTSKIFLQVSLFKIIKLTISRQVQ